MKFCAVLATHPTDTPGGAELQSQLICSELQRRGQDAYYLAHDSEEESRTEHEGVTVLRLNPAEGYRGKREILSTIDRIDPDVLYFRLIKDLPVAALSEYLTGAHVAFNISHDAQCLPRFAHWPGKRDKTLIHTGYRRAKLAVLRSLLAVPDTIFVQTDTQRELLARNWNISGVLTGNGHPVPDEEPEKHSPPVVLWLASIKKWKQPLRFVDAAESCTDLDCEFWMVGQSMDDGLTEEIRSRAESLPNFSYFGGCTVEESNEYIERASVFVNTSKQEGFPNTFIQSWFRKTPVVSLHVDPIDESGQHKTGYYNTETQSELVARIHELVTDTERRNELARNAFAYAREHHDISKVVDEIERGLPRRLCD